MPTKHKTHQLIVHDLVIDVTRKRIKNLHLKVYPPDGQVKVSAPLRINDEAVRLAIIHRLSWIRKQQAKFQAQPRQSPREYVSGESVYFRGQRYRLNVLAHQASPRVHIRNKEWIDLTVRVGSDRGKREQVWLNWCRHQLKILIPPLITKWEPIMGVTVAEWRIKRMKTRWGTCNTQAQRIWLNLELVKMPAHCLEYIVVHEIVHLLERSHNARFKAYMDQFLPSWRSIRDELNQMSLEIQP